MSCTTLPATVSSSIRRRHARAAVSPGGVHASLPPSHSEPFCQAAVMTRSSLVSISTDEPACSAPGAADHALIGSDARLTPTGDTPGSPVMVRSARVASPLPVWETTNASVPALRFCTGWAVLSVGSGAMRVDRSGAQLVRSALLTT